jgi:hypothetical protein
MGSIIISIGGYTSFWVNCPVFLHRENARKKGERGRCLPPSPLFRGFPKLSISNYPYIKIINQKQAGFNYLFLSSSLKTVVSRLFGFQLALGACLFPDREADYSTNEMLKKALIVLLMFCAEKNERRRGPYVLSPPLTINATQTAKA